MDGRHGIYRSCWSNPDDNSAEGSDDVLKTKRHGKPRTLVKLWDQPEAECLRGGQIPARHQGIRIADFLCDEPRTCDIGKGFYIVSSERDDSGSLSRCGISRD